jgi:hypothetical protein
MGMGETMSEQKFELDEVRVNRYNYKAFELSVLRTRTNRKTGETYQEWEPYKYPGNIDAAARGILDILADAPPTMVEDFNSAIERYEAAADKVAAELRRAFPEPR